MQFCPIVPLKWLDVFDKGPCHMVLAQLLENEQYLSYYRDMVGKGHTVILDNGAYEDEQLNFTDLRSAIAVLQPTYYILPDEPNTFRESSMLSFDFLEFMETNLPCCQSKPLWVCHAPDGDLPNFVNSYELGLSHAAGVCFSRLTNRYGLREEVSEMRRVQFIDYLKQLKKWNPLKYHHCLGLLGGSLRELRGLSLHEVDSIDSSAPVWRGLMGYRLEDEWPDFKFCLRPVVWSSSKVDGGLSGEKLAEMNLGKVLKELDHGNT